MLLIELLLFYTEGQYQTRVGHKPKPINDKKSFRDVRTNCLQIR